MEKLTIIIPIFGVIALIFAYFKSSWVNKQDIGTDRMKEICGYIREGAMAFLARAYKILDEFKKAEHYYLAAVKANPENGRLRQELEEVREFNSMGNK